jgi:hypothetical protein
VQPGDGLKDYLAISQSVNLIIGQNNDWLEADVFIRCLPGIGNFGVPLVVILQEWLFLLVEGKAIYF